MCRPVRHSRRRLLGVMATLLISTISILVIAAAAAERLEEKLEKPTPCDWLNINVADPGYHQPIVQHGAISTEFDPNPMSWPGPGEDSSFFTITDSSSPVPSPSSTEAPKLIFVWVSASNSVDGSCSPIIEPKHIVLSSDKKSGSFRITYLCMGGTSTISLFVQPSSCPWISLSWTKVSWTIPVFYFWGGMVSALFCVLVMALYVFIDHERVRAHPSPIIVWRTACDLAFSIVFGMSYWSYNGICTWYGAANQFFLMASNCWYLILAVDVLIALRNPFTAHHAYTTYYHIFAWGIPLITVGVGLYRNTFGMANFHNCWVAPSHNFENGMLVNLDAWYMLYIPLMSFYLFSLIVAALSVYVSKHVFPRRHRDRSHVLDMGIRYVGGYGLFWGATFAVYFATYMDQYQSNVLRIDFAITVAFRGILDFLVWTRNTGILGALRRLVTQRGFDLEQQQRKSNASMYNGLDANNIVVDSVDGVSTPPIPSDIGSRSVSACSSPELYERLERFNSTSNQSDGLRSSMSYLASRFIQPSLDLNKTLREEIMTYFSAGVRINVLEAANTVAIDRSGQPLPSAGLTNRRFKRLDLSDVHSARVSIRECVVEKRKANEWLRTPLINENQEKENIKSYFSVLEYAPSIFQDIRFYCGIPPSSYALAFDDMGEQFSEGRSGMFFYFTKGGRFLVKTMTREEHNVMLANLVNYHSYVTDERNRNCLMNHIFGLYACRHRSIMFATIYFMVCENVSPLGSAYRRYGLELGSFANKTCMDFMPTPCTPVKSSTIDDLLRGVFSAPPGPIEYRFDLKGSWVSRAARAGASLLLDVDFLRIRESVKGMINLDDCVASLRPIAAQRLFRHAHRDARFLASQGLMDYSLFIVIRSLSVEEITALHQLKANWSEDFPFSYSQFLSYLSGEIDDIGPVVPAFVTPGHPTSSNGVDEVPASRGNDGVTVNGIFFPSPESFRLNSHHTLSPSPHEHSSSAAVPFFRRFDGGILSLNGDSVVYFGIIDLTQPYGVSKQMERLWKSLRFRSWTGVSSVDPGLYCERFVIRLRQVFRISE